MDVWVGAGVVPDKRLVRPVDLVRENIQQNFRVGLRAQVPREERLGAFQGIAKLLCVCEVAVVNQVDPERRVDEKGLRLCGRGRAGCRIANVAQPHGALQGVDGLLVSEDVGDEAVGLVLVELGAVDLWLKNGEETEGKSFEWRFFFFFGFFFLPVFFPAQKNRGKTKTHRDHARGVLAAVLQHEQALVKLDAGRARGLVDADDAALAGDGAAAVESFGVERERREKEVERKSTEEARLFACSAFNHPSFRECSSQTTSFRSDSHRRSKKTI